MCCGWNQYKIALILLSLSLSLYLCVMYLIRFDQTQPTSDYDQVLTHRKVNYKKPNTIHVATKMIEKIC